MNRLAPFALTLGLLAAGHAAAQDWSTIRVATEGAYAPWNFTNAAGELDGFEPELMEDLCARMNAECTLVAQAWDGIIPALQAGRYDAIMAGMSITDARREVIDFTRSYATTPAIFVVPKDSDLAAAGLPEIRVDMAEISPDEQALIDQIRELLSGLTVGVQTATIHESFLREHMGDIEIRAYDTQENLDLDLQAGRIDLALADQSGWQPLLEGDAGRELHAGRARLLARHLRQRRGRRHPQGGHRIARAVQRGDRGGARGRHGDRARDQVVRLRHRDHGLIGRARAAAGGFLAPRLGRCRLG